MRHALLEPILRFVSGGRIASWEKCLGALLIGLPLTMAGANTQAQTLASLPSGTPLVVGWREAGALLLRPVYAWPGPPVEEWTVNTQDTWMQGQLGQGVGADAWTRTSLAGQLALYGAAALGWAASGTRLGRAKALALPYYFCLVNAASMVAATHVLRGRRIERWEPEREPRLTSAPGAASAAGGPLG